MFRKLFPALRSRSQVVHYFHRPELEALEDRFAPAFVNTGPFPDDLMGNLQTTGPTSPSFFPGSAPTTFGLSSTSPNSPGTSSFMGFNGFTTAGFQVPLGSTSTAFSLSPFGTGLSAGVPFNGLNTFGGTTAFAGTSFNGLNTVGSTNPFAGLNGLNSVGGTNAVAGATSSASQLTQLEQSIQALFQMAAAQNSSAATSLVINEFFLAIETNTFFRSQELGGFSPAFQDLPARENAINQNPLELTPVGRLLGSMVFEATADLIASTQSGAGTAI